MASKKKSLREVAREALTTRVEPVSGKAYNRIVAAWYAYGPGQKPALNITEYIKQLQTGYNEQRHPDQTFEQWVDDATEEVLRGIRVAEIMEQLAAPAIPAPIKRFPATPAAPAPNKRTVAAAYIVKTYQATTTQGVYMAELTELGVAKGTISKIRTIFEALENGKITVAQVTSIHAAYELATKKPVGFDEMVRLVESMKPQQLVDLINAATEKLVKK